MAQDPDSHSSTAKLCEDTEAFYARGEQAWQDYLRTGFAASADEVVARLDALVAAHSARFVRKQSGDAS